ncbi:MAG: hypothetical protein ACI3YH_08805 [Eubacteriales bacterium]
MITWLNLFEKYRVDRRVLDLYRDELASLDPASRRRTSLEEAIRIAERNVHAAERLLAHYGDGVLSPREALRYADERLFLAYRYLYGLTMEATAIEMNISRDTVYRIRRRIVERGTVPTEVLRRFGIADLSMTEGCAVAPAVVVTKAGAEADAEGSVNGVTSNVAEVDAEDGVKAIAEAERASLPRDATSECTAGGFSSPNEASEGTAGGFSSCADTPSESADDVVDVLAACFAGAPGGIPGGLLARLPGGVPDSTAGGSVGGLPKHSAGGTIGFAKHRRG